MTLTSEDSAGHSTSDLKTDERTSSSDLLSLDELEKTAVPTSKILQQCTRSQSDRRQFDGDFLPSRRHPDLERRSGRDRRLSFY